MDQKTGNSTNRLLRSCQPHNRKGRLTPLRRYRLTTGTDSVRIEAKTSAGTFRGLSTLAQLIEQAEGEKIAGIYIEDQPELNGRGFMLDVSRCKVPDGGIVRIDRSDRTAGLQ